MPGPAPKPREQRRNRVPKPRGDWQQPPALGWQHGEIPPAPDGMMLDSYDTWSTWMHAWWASHWTPDDLPGLRTTILLFDAVQRRDFNRVTELRQWMDGYGITFKGRQDRRWSPPQADELAPPQPAANPYAHLRPVG